MMMTSNSQKIKNIPGIIGPIKQISLVVAVINFFKKVPFPSELFKTKGS